MDANYDQIIKLQSKFKSDIQLQTNEVVSDDKLAAN